LVRHLRKTIIRCVGRTRSSTAAKNPGRESPEARAGLRASAIFIKAAGTATPTGGASRPFLLGLAGKQYSFNERLDRFDGSASDCKARCGERRLPRRSRPAKDRSGIFRINKGLYGKLHHGCVLFVLTPVQKRARNTVYWRFLYCVCRVPSVIVMARRRGAIPKSFRSGHSLKSLAFRGCVRKARSGSATGRRDYGDQPSGVSPSGSGTFPIEQLGGLT